MSSLLYMIFFKIVSYSLPNNVRLSTSSDQNKCALFFLFSDVHVNMDFFSGLFASNSICNKTLYQKSVDFQNH
jgi:hypothetical protein